MKGRAVFKFHGTWSSPVDCEIEATLGDYGRSDNPSIEVQGEINGFTFEFSHPDAARQFGERLLALARKAEEKAGSRGPEYRAQLAREEAITELRALVERFETAVADRQAVLPESITSKL